MTKTQQELLAGPTRQTVSFVTGAGPNGGRFSTGLRKFKAAQALVAAGLAVETFSGEFRNGAGYGQRFSVERRLSFRLV